MTAYAEAVVQRMEQTQEVVPTSVLPSADEFSDEIRGLPNSTELASNSETGRSNTPILLVGDGDTGDDLSALESALKVAIDPE